MPQKNILYIGNKLSKYGYTRNIIETLGPQLASEGYFVNYAGDLLNPISRFLQMIWRVIMLRNRVDYVLIDTFSTKAFWFAWSIGILCRLLSIKYIPILHGGNLPFRLIKSPFSSNIIFSASYANVAVSNFLKEAFDEQGYKAVVIPNNIDINDYRFIKRDFVGPKLLWVRSFHKQYNPRMAADVLKLLINKFQDAELCMVGPDKDGSKEDFLDYCKEIEVFEKVKVTGKMEKLDWLKLSSEYDIFINTTKVDNTPISLIEAMALGLPIVSTNVGGIPYLIEDRIDGILVEDSAQDMYNSIIELIQNPTLAEKLSFNGRIKAESYDWSEIKLKWKLLLT